MTEGQQAAYDLMGGIIKKHWEDIDFAGISILLSARLWLFGGQCIHPHGFSGALKLQGNPYANNND